MARDVDQKADFVVATGVPFEKTLGGLIAAYLAGRHFGKKAERTQADYRKLLEADWIKQYYVQPITDITPEAAQHLIERALTHWTWSGANYLLRVLSAVFSWGAEHRSGIVASNPFAKIEPFKKPEGAPTFNRAWEPWEFEAVIRAASPQLKIALMLGRYANIPEGVVRQLPWSAYDGTNIEYCTKNGDAFRVLVSPALKKFLDESPRLGTQMVLHRRGEPFKGHGFRGSFFKLLRRLQKENKVQPGLTFHGFTRTRVREMYKAGATKLEIMAAIGHITPKMVDLYLQELERERQAERTKQNARWFAKFKRP